MVEEQRRRLMADFLRARRARLAPAAEDRRRRRRTAGLTREEVAARAAISPTWYTWIEQARDIHVSNAALERIADALELDVGERNYLYALAGLSLAVPVTHGVRASLSGLQLALDGYGTSSAQLLGPRLDILGANLASRLVFVDHLQLPIRERNVAWQLFCNPAMRQLIVDWETNARGVLALLRLSWGHHLDDRALGVLVDDLQSRSTEFRQWWEAQDVAGRPVERKELDHPLVGRLVFHQQGFHVFDHPELTMVLDTPCEGTDTQEKVRHLLDMAANDQNYQVVADAITTNGSTLAKRAPG